jgi:glycosyltransferase involved in cell wall biosynthesis
MTNPGNIQWPRISIITPSYNQGSFIEETMRSILDQGYPNLEYIVIDGGSTDESVELIEQYADRLAYWVSEPDRGQSHAINKGAERATGEIMQWINSDDVLMPGALEKVAKQFMQDPSTTLVAGKTLKFGDGKKEQLVPRAKHHQDFEEFLFQAWFMQPSCFFRGDVFKALMPLNEALHYTMDTDLFVRYFLRYGRENIVELDDVLVRFRMHDDSKTFSSQLDFYSERIQIDAQVMHAAGVSDLLPTGNIVMHKVDLAPYDIGQEINLARLRQRFDEKWLAWISDPSKRFREVADYAGLHGDFTTMRTFSWKAIQRRPWKLLNWRYWLHTLMG